MKKILFVGDFSTETGPAMVNKLIIRGLHPQKISYVRSEKLIFRVVELISKMLLSEGICFCSYSKLNFIGLYFAKIFKKKCFYIMHGYRSLEAKINDPHILQKNHEVIINKEKKLFSLVDKIYCVSEKFMEFMKISEPMYSEKFDYNYNPVNYDEIIREFSRGNYKKKTNQIVSIGGGMRRKGNLSVCKAIDKLNKELGLELKFIVIGLPYSDKNDIESYNFVTYYDKLAHQDVITILSESNIYIQNSRFETFGLSVIEALFSKCNLLISNKVGALGVINTVQNDDLIFEQDDIEEISRKIYNLLQCGNKDRLLKGIDYEKIEYHNASNNLINKISNELAKNNGN